MSENENSSPSFRQRFNRFYFPGEEKSPGVIRKLSLISKFKASGTGEQL